MQEPKSCGTVFKLTPIRKQGRFPPFSKRMKKVFSIEKAVRLLGYAPRTFGEGMRLTAEWLRYYEYI